MTLDLIGAGVEVAELEVGPAVARRGRIRMLARSIEPVPTVSPSGPMISAPITIVRGAVREADPDPDAAAVARSRSSRSRSSPALPGMQVWAAAVKPSGKTTGSPLAAGEELGDALASVGAALADSLGGTLSWIDGTGVSVGSTPPTPGSELKTPASTAPAPSASTPSARKPRMANAPAPDERRWRPSSQSS